MSDETQHEAQDAQDQPPEGELSETELTGVAGGGILRPPSHGDQPLDGGPGEIVSGGFTRII